MTISRKQNNKDNPLDYDISDMMLLSNDNDKNNDK